MKIFASLYLLVSRAAILAFALCLFLAFTGCTTIRYPYTGVPESPAYKSLTGNWQITVNPTVGPAPFTQLRGYINEQSTGTAAGYTVDASLQLSGPSSCYLGALLLPSAGQLLTDQLGLYSFTVNGQYFDTMSTVNSTATSFMGTYVVEDGCAGNLSSAGTIVGTRYANLNGDFTGPISDRTPGASLTLALTQVATGDSDGSFDISGTAEITGLTCYTQKSLSSLSGKILGNSVQLVFNDPATASQVTVAGTFNAAADTILLNSIIVSGGSCAGSVGTATLALQG